MAAEEPDAAGSVVMVEAKPWPAWSRFYHEALLDLVSSHPITFTGIAPIPFEVYDAYARRYDITGWHFDFFIRVMRALDNVYIEWIKVKAKGSPSG